MTRGTYFTCWYHTISFITLDPSITTIMTERYFFLIGSVIFIREISYISIAVRSCIINCINMKSVNATSHQCPYLTVIKPPLALGPRWIIKNYEVHVQIIQITDFSANKRSHREHRSPKYEGQCCIGLRSKTHMKTKSHVTLFAHNYFPPPG